MQQQSQRWLVLGTFQEVGHPVERLQVPSGVAAALGEWPLVVNMPGHAATRSIRRTSDHKAGRVKTMNRRIGTSKRGGFLPGMFDVPLRRALAAAARSHACGAGVAKKVLRFVIRGSGARRLAPTTALGSRAAGRPTSNGPLQKSLPISGARILLVGPGPSLGKRRTADLARHAGGTTPTTRFSWSAQLLMPAATLLVPSCSWTLPAITGLLQMTAFQHGRT